jgi:cell division protein DivIC
MKKVIQKIGSNLKVFKNKYLLAFTLFFVYSFFLEEEDIFLLVSQNVKLSNLKAEKEQVDLKLKSTRSVLKKLDYTSEIERYARENKYFKMDDEEIFVISHE